MRSVLSTLGWPVEPSYMATMRRLLPLLLALDAALLLVIAVVVQARPRECVVAQRLDDVAKSVWWLPEVPTSGHASNGIVFCTSAEETSFGPLTIREECARCTSPPDSWCDGSVLTVTIRPRARCADAAPWSVPVARGRAVDLSNHVDVRADASQRAIVVIANRGYFDDKAWTPYQVTLPTNRLYEPMSNVRAVTFRVETRRGVQAGRDAFALAATAVAIALARRLSRSARARPIVAAAAGLLAVALSLYALVTSI